MGEQRRPGEKGHEKLKEERERQEQRERERNKDRRREGGREEGTKNSKETRDTGKTKRHTAAQLVASSGGSASLAKLRQLAAVVGGSAVRNKSFPL